MCAGFYVCREGTNGGQYVIQFVWDSRVNTIWRRFSKFPVEPGFTKQLV